MTKRIRDLYPLSVLTFLTSTNALPTRQEHAKPSLLTGIKGRSPTQKASESKYFAPFATGKGQGWSGNMPRLQTMNEIDRLKHLESDGLDGIWDWYIQDNYEYMSPRFWEIFGYDHKEKKPDPKEWQELIFKEDLTLALKNFDKHVETKGKYPFLQESRYRHKNGSTVWVLCRGKVIEWDKGGAPIRMIGTHTDITPLKELQETLDLKTKMFDALIEHTMDGFWSWEVGTDNDEISDRWYKTLGYEPGEFPNSYQTWIKLLHPDDVEEAEMALHTHINNPQKPYECISRYKCKDGSYKYILDQGYAIRDIDGSATYMVGTHTDIDKLKQTENRLTKKNDELSQFAYAASHDLQSPLRTISAFLEKIEKSFKGELNERQKKWMQFTIKAAKNLQAMIGDMKSIATLDASQEDRKLKHELSLEAFEDALINLDSDIKKSKAVITHGDLPSVKMPRSHQIQVFQNLISNAIKYSETKPIIHVDSKNDGPDVIFSVSDKGQGIPLEMRGRVFNMFRRVHNKVPGKGVGLTLVKKIVESYEGSIWLESEEGKGTTFYFSVKG